MVPTRIGNKKQTKFNDAFEDVSGVVRNAKAVGTMKERIEELCDVHVDRFWIGKTSSGRAGMRNRWNTKYAALGMQHAAIVYQTSSEDKALELEDTELGRRIAPLQAQRDEVDGYLQLAHVQPSLVPADMPADAPPTILLAAQRRLAIAGIGSARLGAGSILPSDVAEMVAFHVRGFDHVAEAAKVEEHGEEAAAARLQFRPPLPAAGQKPEATGFQLEDHRSRPTTACTGCTQSTRAGRC